MLQESVYTKMCLNMNAANVVAHKVRRNRLNRGLIQLMVITESQYARIEFITGERDSTYIQSDERLIVLWKWSTQELLLQ